MALDPTRYPLTQTLNGGPAVSVSLAWIQAQLNAAFGAVRPSIAVDGVFGPETRAAVTYYLFDMLHVDRETMMKNGKFYTAELIPGTEGRVAITPAFEQALAAAGSAPAIGIGVALIGVIGTVLIVRKVLRDPGTKRRKR